MSRTLLVAPGRPGAYPSITAAVLDAPVDAVISIAPGAYYETVDLADRSLTLVADAGEVVIDATTAPVPALRCSNGRLALRELTIRAGDAPAVQLDGGTLRAERCALSAGFGPVLLVTGPAELSVSHCQVDGGEHGLVLEDCTAQVEHTKVNGVSADGVIVRLGATAVLRDCQLTDCGRRGVYAYQYGRPTLESCEISGTAEAGVLIAYDSTAVLRHTLVRDTAGPAIVYGRRCRGEVVSCRWENTAEPALDVAEPELVSVTAAPQVEVQAVEPTAADVESLLKELDAMVGLASVKDEVRSLIDELQVNEWRRKAGLPIGSLSHHLVFAGAPGTGKTTVARIYGKLLAALGVLPKGQFNEVARRDLVGQFLGHTAEKTTTVFESATGGVLFIDEAYALSRAGAENDSFGQEAIDTLVKLMEDHRDEAAVIVAGYSDEMVRFMDANPGLASRFSKTIDFENYAPDELTLIVQRMVAAQQYDLDDDAAPILERHFAVVSQAANFGNARDARRLFDRVRKAQSQRLRRLGGMPSVSELRTFQLDDVIAAVS
ncbi:AAA family ATPase [Kribbella hippodromi]|uniref:AAA family ATPase n=1 Tax=Kribbella hippodromi TaxID=434347 RepID=UPI0031D31CBD